MPPKKQEEEQSAPTIVWTVLPISNSALALQALRKPVTMKKVLDVNKIIELLKEKGIQKYLNQGKLSRQGELFLSQNLFSAGQQYLVQARKPVDPKKDQKKDTKKDSKKQQVVVEEGEKPLEFNFQKGVTEFLFYLSVPLDGQALEKAVQGGLKPQVVVWIEQKVKEGSEKPNYDLLNNQRTIEDFMKEMSSTSPEKGVIQKKNENVLNDQFFQKEPIKILERLRMKSQSPLENTIVIEVPFEKDLGNPGIDSEQFLTQLFKKLCQLSLEKDKFEKWCKSQKKVPMVPTIKQTIKKQVVVEEKKEDKKAGKKEAASQPVTQIVEEIIERKYESFPENIKSDLVIYQRIAKHRQSSKTCNEYYKILEDLAYAVSSEIQPHSKIENFRAMGLDLWAKQKSKPLSKIGVKNLKDQISGIRSSESSERLTFKVNLKPHPVHAEISLSSIMKQSPFEVSLEHEYKIQQLTTLSNRLGNRISFKFDRRKYVERLSPSELNSRINLELQFDPEIYYGECTDDGYNILVLARINPPGRVFYYNHFFQWKVMPNFQFWEEHFKNTEGEGEFWDYGWRSAGNLKILSKKMMPTDNMIISEGTYNCGDAESRLITLSRDNVQYGLHRIAEDNHLLWKHYNDLKTLVYTKSQQISERKDVRAQIEVCIQRKEFSVLFNPYPTIFWHRHELESSRTFGPRGEITKRMKNGAVEILYPNGDVSVLQFGRWKHIKNSTLICEDEPERQIRVEHKTNTDKKIAIREDSTVLVTYPNKDKLIIFNDGTIIHKKGKSRLQILNPESIVIRINVGRDKDFNVIGAGSAFAYLGFHDISERSYDGALYELYHPSFSWHTYTEGVDRLGKVSQEQVMLVAYPDKSMMKIGDNGLLTFLNKATDDSEAVLQQRWIQLFTAPEYHLEGVYDVDLIEGQIRTRDGESNSFRVRVDGSGQNQIAVSFNIGGRKKERNSFGEGFHVAEENYFLPPPHNHIPPKLFVIYPDGRGEEYLTEEQLHELKGWRTVNETVEGRKITQYSKQIAPSSTYLSHTFSQGIDLSVFTVPSLIDEVAIRPSNIRYSYNSVQFRCIEEIDWDRGFTKINQIRERTKAKRKALQDEIESLRFKIKG